MISSEELDQRLRGYLARRAAEPAPVTLEARLLRNVREWDTHGSPRPARLTQFLATVAMVILAIGLGFAFLYARSHMPARFEPNPTPAPTSNLEPSSSAAGWWRADFISDSIGWFVRRVEAAGGGSADHSVLYGTTDGARHWQQLSSVKGDLGPLWVNGSEVLAVQADSVGGGCVKHLLHSSDEGAHWTVRNFPSTVSDVLPFFLPDLRSGWLVDFSGNMMSCGPGPVSSEASRGFVWRTSDGGQNWLPVADTETFGIAGVYAVRATAWSPSSAAVMVGGANVHGKLFVTHDAGVHWQPAQVAAPGNVLGIGTPVMFDDQRGLAPGGDTVMRTADGGYHWSRLVPLSLPATTPSRPGKQIQLTLGTFLSDRRWITAGSGLYVTNDSGQTWREVTPVVPSVGQDGWAVSFMTPSLGVASFGERGFNVTAVFKTTDGGSHWGVVNLPAN